MKQLTLAALLIITSFLTKAQLKGKISEVKIQKDSLLFLSLPDVLGINRPKYKFLFENEKGKVFESPVDKMRCQSFGFNSLMPVAGNLLKNSIPSGTLQMPNPMLNDLSIPAPLTQPDRATLTK